MIQLELWQPSRRPGPPWPRLPAAGPDWSAVYACPGCGAHAGQWAVGRFAAIFARWGYIPLCEECARIPEVGLDHLRNYQAPPPAVSEYAGGDDMRIAEQCTRFELGQALDHPADAAHRLPVVRKVLAGLPEWEGVAGETGVERCGARWRVRPFWRGRKWPLGTFRYEDDAIQRSRLFHLVHGEDDRPKPLKWLPCADDDVGVAIEDEHISNWRADYPGAPALRIVRQYARELKQARPKPDLVEVWWTLLNRLAAAAGETLFGHLLAGSMDTADELAGV